MIINAIENPLPPPPPDFKPPSGKKTRKIAAIAIAAIVVIAVVIVGVYFFANTAPNNSINNSTTSLPESDWSITQVTDAPVSSTIYASLGLSTYTFTPTSSSDSFLTVTFDLAPTSGAGTLDLQNIVLTVDGQPYTPSGMDSRVGILTGNVTQNKVEAQIIFQEGGSDMYTIYWPVHDSTQNIDLIYVVPTAYLNSGHNLQLQISGTNEAKPVYPTQP